MTAEKRLSIWWLRGVATLLGISFPGIGLILNRVIERQIRFVTADELTVVLIVLLAVIGFFVAWFVVHRPWLKWDISTGTWVNRFSSIRYCEKCKATKSVVTPLKNEITGWRCMTCERFYSDPERRPAEKEPKKRIRNERI